MFGPQLFKKLTVFSLVIISASLSIVTTTSIFLGNTYVIMITMFFLAAIAGVASIKMEQWLVTSVDHKILASTVGLLNTILMAVAPIMTTVLTTISGSFNVTVALVTLLVIQVITLIVAIFVSLKTRKVTQNSNEVAAA